MAVFTEVSESEARDFVARLAIGTLTGFDGIQAGIENSNFFVDTTRGHWVLTIFERLSFAQLPFYLQLMRHLARRGIPVPEPQADRNGEILATDVRAPSLFAEPHRIIDVDEAVELLMRRFPNCRSRPTGR